MRIEYDLAKRAETLRRRGLDMADVAEVFVGRTLTIVDDRRDYGEPRFVSIGYLRQRLVFVAWTQRGESCRVISMRKANAREIARFEPELRSHS